MVEGSRGSEKSLGLPRRRAGMVCDAFLRRQLGREDDSPIWDVQANIQDGASVGRRALRAHRVCPRLDIEAGKRRLERTIAAGMVIG